MQTQYYVEIQNILKNNNVENNISLNSSLPIPIPIPMSNNNNTHASNALNQYSLNLNNFNPSKMSPPDNWKSRLQLRLKNHSLNPHSFNK